MMGAFARSRLMHWAVPSDVFPDLDTLLPPAGNAPDTIYSDKQKRLLASAFHARPGSSSERSFLATNVPVYIGVRRPPVAPDVLFSLEGPPADTVQKNGRCYYL